MTRQPTGPRSIGYTGYGYGCGPKIRTPRYVEQIVHIWNTRLVVVSLPREQTDEDKAADLAAWNRLGC